ncbi:MAG TPA: ABC transporter substrate-binding protein [Polyangiaceae bacterium]|jgi:NitT/TauT family transport system substrate-binding protein|nr:ABC transporter substrate-binding protein [Polyangiaceae bacterium]
MERRHALRALVALVCVINTGACSKTEPAAGSAPAASLATALASATPAPEPAKPAAPITLTVGHDLWVGYSGVFIATELGFFKDAGLDVKLKPFSNPGDTLPALVSGQLDIGLTTLQNLAVLNGNSETDVVAVGLVDSSNGADAVVAKKQYASLKDLKGKTVALTLGEVNHFLFLVGLKQNGLDASSFKITSMSADDAGAAFVAGKVDAAVTWEPWVTKASKAGGHTIFSSASVPDTIMDSVAVRRSHLKEQGPAYLSFLKAIDRGVAMIKSDPEKSATIIGKYLSAPAEDVKGMLAGDKIYGLSDNKTLFGTAAEPGPAYKSMKSVVDFALESKLVKKAPAPESLFEPSLIRQ